MKFKLLFVILFYAAAANLLGQVEPQTQLYREDAKGNFQFRREGVMDGNLVRTLFYNTGEVAQWPFQPSGEWPKGSGHSYLDGVTVLIASQVTSANGLVIHPLEAYYREEMDRDPVTAEIWGLSPVPNYSNPSSTKPAINKDRKSWPSEWPRALNLTPDWNGYWYGYFGRGVFNSDFETFFVMDDNRDGEFRRAPYSYFPIASDTTWGGLGLRVEVRGFQWSHVLAEDIIFWHYDIVNISDYDHDSTCFGFYSDPGVGGEGSAGDNVFFDRKLDITYAWDNTGLGLPGNWVTGYYGYAYLESPGNALDGIDNDEDGMIDERRDDGIDNDKDWVGYSDLNGNGKWDADENEPLNNDVGRDGVGPFDPQYLGPDYGEGDGIPTGPGEGGPGEPNFDYTDKDESDQLGLQAVSLTILSDKGPSGVWPKNDEVVWAKMTGGFKDTAITNTNVSMVFSSGPFPLKKNKRERFSMALVFGNNLEDLLFNKETVQQIYNANYNFSKPPLTPTLTAVAGDKKVYLYWDKKAEESRDPFLGYQNNDPRQGFKKDFEGYLLYRSEEAEFNDIKVITDSKGDAKYWKPIAQFDLVDSMQIDSTTWVKVAGPDPVGINGARFWRGSQTGLQHSYIDTDVENGRRYYYALVSYDMGDPKFGTSGLQPSECTKIITEDFAGNVQFLDINCAIVTPNSPASGYIPPQVNGDIKHVSQGEGTGMLNLTILNPGAIKNGAAYKILFNSTEPNPQYKTLSYNIIRTYNGVTDTLERNLDTTTIGAGRVSPPFDGIAMTVLNDSVGVIDSLTGWIAGTCNMRMTVTADATTRSTPWPADYEIEFFNSVQDTTYFYSPPLYTNFEINFKVFNKSQGHYAKVAIADNDGSNSLTPGDLIQIVEFKGTPSISNSRIAWNIAYNLPSNPFVTPKEPGGGDKFQVGTSKPFKTSDYFGFSAVQSSLDKEAAKNQLDKISVVPNPYLGAASWERRNLNSSGRGERKIDFINLPAKCTIRIYTISGALVKTLNKDSNIDNGAITWNLESEDGMEIAYGVYIYHVDAEGIGERIGKFAVIK